MRPPGWGMCSISTWASPRIGRASATLDLRCLSSGMRRFGGTATLVHANLETGRSLPWPDDLRDRMGAYLHTPKKVKEPT